MIKVFYVSVFGMLPTYITPPLSTNGIEFSKGGGSVLPSILSAQSSTITLLHRRAIELNYSKKIIN